PVHPGPLHRTGHHHRHYALHPDKDRFHQSFKTQFYNPEHEEAETYISSPEFFDSVIGRAREFGKSIGVTYGEGFTCRKLLGVDSLFELS
ncbi:hypothetical protein PBAL39_06006, partial [Pedobacter sp. BAL39]